MSDLIKSATKLQVFNIIFAYLSQAEYTYDETQEFLDFLQSHLTEIRKEREYATYSDYINKKPCCDIGKEKLDKQEFCNIGKWLIETTNELKKELQN